MDERQDRPKVQSRTRSTSEGNRPRRTGVKEPGTRSAEGQGQRRSGDPERVRRSGDSERVRRPGDSERVRHSGAPERVRRPGDPERVRRSGDPEKERRPDNPEKVRRSGNPEKVRRSGDPERVRRSGDPESVRRTSELEKTGRSRDPKRVKRSGDPEKDVYSGDLQTRREDNGSQTRRQSVRHPSSELPQDHAGNRSGKKKGVIIFIFLLLILLIGGMCGALYWLKYGPSKETANRDEYYGITSKDQLAVTIDNEVVGAVGKVIDGTPYIDYATVRDYINSRFYWDPNENILLYTLPQEVIRVEAGSSEYSIASGTQSAEYEILKMEGDVPYIALDFVQQRTNLDYTMHEDPDRVMIITKWGDTNIAEVKSETQVRWLAGVKSAILREVDKKEQVVIIEEEGDWKKVRTDDGYIGYIRKGALDKETVKKTSREFAEDTFTNITKDYTINLGWHQVTSQAANNHILEVLDQSKGMNTISPTWFSVADNAGNINSIASSDYVNYAHQANVEVWALVDNFSKDVDSFELLSRTSSRENLTNQLIEAVLETGIDGINVDFETISKKTGEHFIQFIRELSVKCRQNGIVLSVDNYVPKGYSAHYNRREQGIVADYVIIMGYDEHFGGSYEAGSVASINYVKEGIAATLDEIQAEKVINAVPFYTRLWAERPKTAEEQTADVGTEAEEYSLHVESKAMGMSEAAEKVAAAGVTPQWDQETQQDYAQWEEGGQTYKIWLENKASLEAKLSLMKEYNLAGTAAWKIGFETPDIWELISKYVN